MKRRAVSFIIVLALCLSLCPVRVLAADDADPGPLRKTEYIEDTTVDSTYNITDSRKLDTCGNSFTVTKETAVSVTGTGRLYLTTGTIESQNGAGIEVLDGGFLRVDEADMTVIGTTYGLDLAAGATVRLSGGTFTGNNAAIRMAGNHFTALLASAGDIRYAYFDENGDPIALTDVGGKTTVTVKKCTNHVYSYASSGGVPSHDGICIYCEAEDTDVPCKFSFDAVGVGTCADCKRKIEIFVAIDEDSLVYDGDGRPAEDSVSVKVMLDGGKELEDTDYTVELTKGTNAGETITVTVDGVTYEGTFKKEYSVTQAEPEITWAVAGPVVVPYDGSQVDETKLPAVVIKAAKNSDEAYLRQYLYFSYRKAGDSDAAFTRGLPTDAGVYEIRANLPATENYKAASSSSITLTISKIDPIIEAPEAKDLTYNRKAQKLVTPGVVWDGAVILYAASGNGPWSTEIPTGTDAGLYEVWYMVEETENFNTVVGTVFPGVEIKRKEITPDVKLEYTSHVYTGGELQPQVIVSDKDDGTELPVTEYAVNYKDNVNVGKNATVTVSDRANKEKGNYKILTVQVSFEITAADQAALTITGQPNTVVYGDVFTLGTVGGSGDGTVTWAIVDGSGIAEVDEGGQVTVKGVGKVTVQATKSGADYKEMTAKWTFTAGPRPVTAKVTAADKVYNGNANATVNAVVEQGVVLGDEITIDGLSGTFSNGSGAGTGKTVSVTGTAVIKVNGTLIVNGSTAEKYIVTIPKTTTASITKAAAEIKTAPKGAALTYSGTGQELLSSGAVAGFTTTVDNTTLAVEYSLNKDGAYSTAIPTATNAGTYQVWYRVQESANYTGVPAAMVEVTIKPKTVNNPTVELSQASYEYDGAEKRPAVTVKDGNDVISSSEYTVTYSNNVNAGEATGANPPTVTITDKAGGNYAVNGTATFTIKKNIVTNPRITLSSDTFRYNGSQQKPAVTVRDDDGFLIAEREYVVTITGTSGNNSMVTVDTYTVKITTPESSNYDISVNNTTTYQIVAADQESISITGMHDQVYYGDKIQLGVTGGTGEGTVTWSIEAQGNVKTTANTINNSGLLTINEVGGPYIVTATRTSAGNYSTVTTTWEFSTNKKPVTAVLTGVNKVYDGEKNATVEARVNPGDLVSGDSIDAFFLKGEFDDPNVGTNKRITNISTSAGTAITGTNAEKYAITYPATATASITPKEIKPTVTVTGGPFTYDGIEHRPDVAVEYTDGSLNLQPSDYTVTYSDNINAGVNTAIVTVRNVDGGNYTFIATANFTIKKAEITAADVTAPTPKTGLTYTGTAQELLQAGGGSPYGKMVYSLTQNGTYSENIPTGINAGDYTIFYKVQCDSNHNDYEVSDPVQVTIDSAEQEQLVIVDSLSGPIYNGEIFGLSTTGGSGDGAITWGAGNSGIAEIDPNSGRVKVTGVGEFTITVTKAASTDGNYKAASATRTFTAYPSPLTQEELAQKGITLAAEENLTYNYESQELIKVVGDEAGKLLYSVNGGGYGSDIPKGTDAGTYTVLYKMQDDDNHVGSVTVTIAKATPNIDEWPTASPINYREPLSRSTITGGSASYGDAKTSVPGTFAWVYPQLTLLATQSQSATFIPNDQTNFENVSISILVVVNKDSSGGTSSTSGSGTNTPSTSEPGTGSASVQTSVQNGTASTVVNGAAADGLVDEAVASQSENVVIKPEIPDDVSKTEVSIPAKAVGRIGSETDAALTVSTPVADVTIPNGALETLSGAGDTVSVVTERVDNTVVLTLTADGEDVGDIPGGLTLTVPMESTGPGTVAVLVYEDGTREIIRWSVAEDGAVRIPLDGSTTVEIVDNSKEFADVSEENWESDAVAFASAHELFIGTSETDFSPELTMSLGMLATVLYNLEGKPEQELAARSGDIDSDVWYAPGMSWAVANGVVNGYEDGRFGPDDDMTREQLALMLWRYMGSPETDVQTLDFLDADQAGGDAMEALCWAAANGILKGYGDGCLDPNGAATRAQAAQMLKNLIENT